MLRSVGFCGRIQYDDESAKCSMHIEWIDCLNFKQPFA